MNLPSQTVALINAIHVYRVIYSCHVVYSMSRDILTNDVHPLGDPHLLFKLNKKLTNRTNTIARPMTNTA